MIMTIQEIFNTCDNYDDFCMMKGISLCSLNKGGRSIQVEITIEQAHELGIVKSINKKVIK